MEEIMKSGVQYVYMYWIDGIARYVGNGKGKRILDHLNISRANKQLKDLIASSLSVKYEIISSGTQEEMDILERELIQKYGRLVDESGSLCNKLTGGKKQWNVDEETKLKISNSQSGNKGFMFGKEGTLKNKFAFSHPSTKQKYQQIHLITGEVVAEFIGNQALKDAGFNQSNCHLCANGKLKTHKGFKWKIVQL